LEYRLTNSEPTFTRERPSSLQQWAFKIPAKFYSGRQAEFFKSRCVLQLTTIGRKSGLPRTIAVSFMPHNDSYVIFSGFGIESNWYQNILANPDVLVKVGKHEFKARASVVEDPAQRKQLMLEMRDRSANCGPPQFIRSLLKLTRAFDYDGEIQMAVDNAETIPVVELTPEKN
jgi:deazaflavin-dependent oxidoreductase (nitroreductase family)